MAKGKVELFKSKAAMAKHEKAELPKKAMAEKKSGERDIIKKKGK